MLASRDAVRGRRVLDLFAGTGALAFEALSRGAETATMVESGRVGQRLISENIRALDAGEQAVLMRNDATRLGTCSDAPFDLVFLDPPYGRGLGEKALAALLRGGWLAPDALVVWEEGVALDAPPGFLIEERRRFGDTWITLLSHATAAS